ncbi:hypothetical protein VSH64_11370 [Amycolatopsis rhabdoformis]|uniref:DUF2269 domain-containing protein n=1 Tax=Amycolatopsis rhabdoformis TaxID=1448059 RepID=A0ABZ1IFJ4_9PSEU|nr:hypothetical protein [Amycolatopsis rhabdoformis]WSE32702.1 hypothetical protein VSH64_11370 [Amycolatopsis rhabdoformis]
MATGQGWRLGARTRKWYLVGHLVSAAAWFGLDLALGILAVTAMVTDDPAVITTSLHALQFFAVWPMFAASVLTLATGTVLGLSSRYGLVRYWWVVAKLAVNVLMAVLILVALRPGIDAAGNPADLLPPVVVAPSLLLFSYLATVFKPWGRVRRTPAGKTLVRDTA